MLFDLLNSCLQSFYKIANINISIWIILLIPVVLVIFQYLYAVHIETKYKNDTYISEDGTEPNKSKIAAYFFLIKKREQR